MPKQIRDMTNTPLVTFKRALDKYLALIPDEPLICNYTAFRRADTNSIIDMQKFASAVAAPTYFQEHHNRGGELNNLQAWGIASNSIKRYQKEWTNYYYNNYTIIQL